jgi:hypothetical protein
MQMCLISCIMHLSSSPSLARVMGEEGAVRNLVDTMRASPELPLRSMAANALAELIRHSASRTTEAAKCGAVPAAAQLALGTLSPIALQRLARVLQCTLAHLKPKQLPERQRGLILKACMHLLSSSSSHISWEVALLAMGCLTQLALHDFTMYATGTPLVYAPAMLQPGGVVRALLQQLRAGGVLERMNSMRLLNMILPAADAQQLAAAVAAGALETTLAVAQSEVAAGALETTLAVAQSEVAAGALETTLAVAQSEVPQEAAAAARLVARLGAIDGRNAKLAAQQGAIPYLMRAVAVQQAAGAAAQPGLLLALSNMLVPPCPQQHLQQALERGILQALVLQLQRGAEHADQLPAVMAANHCSLHLMHQGGHEEQLLALVQPLVSLQQQREQQQQLEQQQQRPPRCC